MIQVLPRYAKLSIIAQYTDVATKIIRSTVSPSLEWYAPEVPRRRLEISHILRSDGPVSRQVNAGHIGRAQIKVILAIEAYRTCAGDRQRTMRLATGAFTRRFLMHALSDGLRRIRHSGLLAGATRKANIAQVRALLGSVQLTTAAETEADRLGAEGWAGDSRCVAISLRQQQASVPAIERSP